MPAGKKDTGRATRSARNTPQWLAKEQVGRKEAKAAKARVARVVKVAKEKVEKEEKATRRTSTLVEMMESAGTTKGASVTGVNDRNEMTEGENEVCTFTFAGNTLEIVTCRVV